MSNYLKKRKYDNFLLNTSYLGPTFTTVGATTLADGVQPFISLRAVVCQPDGKILIAGDFSNIYRGSGKTTVIRLNPDGSEDSAFSKNAVFTSSGAACFGENQTGINLALTSDNYILVTGFNVDYAGNLAMRQFVRIGSDGVLDLPFSNAVSAKTIPFGSFNTTVYSTAYFLDEYYYIAGAFSNYDGGIANYVIKVDAGTGIQDVPFSGNAGLYIDNIVYSVKVQSDEKVLMVGEFTNYITRLNPDGTSDSVFWANVAGKFLSAPTGIYIQSDGKIVVYGGFTTFGGDVSKKYIIRLNSNGTEDTTFTNAITRNGVTPNFNNTVTSYFQDSDSKIYIGGTFTNYGGNFGLSYLVAFNSSLTLNTTFNSNAVTNGASSYFSISSAISTNCMITKSTTGQLIIYGSFNSYKSIDYLNKIIVLNVDGTLDLELSKSISMFGTRARKFHNSLADCAYSTIDDNYVFAGSFAYYGPLNYYFPLASNIGQPSRLLKLDSTGNVNTTFANNQKVGTTSQVFSNGNIASIAMQADGKIVCAGTFTNVRGVSSANYLARINSDGTVDNSFLTNATVSGVAARFSSTLISASLQSDGKILVCGNFLAYTGTGASPYTGINYAVRLNADGTEDRSFTDNAIRSGTVAKFGSTVHISLQLSTGNILFGGQFGTYNSTASLSRLIMVAPDGTIGASQTAFINNAVRYGSAGTAKFGSGFISCMVEQPDGKILIGGSFTNYSITTEGGGISRLVRLNADGTLDTAFVNNACRSGTTAKFTGNIIKINIQDDGKILVSGVFTSYGGLLGISRLIRLNADGTLDSEFSSNASAYKAVTRFSSSVSFCYPANSDTLLVGGAFRNYNEKLTNQWDFNKFDYFVVLNSKGNIK